MTVTVKEPAADPVQERVEIPEVVLVLRVILVGLRVHVRPVDGETVFVNPTVPVKPLVAETVIVEVPGEPITTLTLVGLAAMVKSVTVKVAAAECESIPLVPVTVRT